MEENTMTNPDVRQERLNDIRARMSAGVMAMMSEETKETGSAEFEAALKDYQKMISDEILAKYEISKDVLDSNILAARGIRQLTSEERAYYTAIINAMKSADPRAAITNVNLDFPTTTINSVLEDIRTAHPLLDFIDFVNTSAVTKWIYNTQGEQSAVWGELGAEIVTELTGSIAQLSMTQCKLSAFFTISNDILELGPEWVDVYIRATLTEAYAVGLEAGVVDGTGKDQPIGMTRNVADDVVVVGGVYPRKEAIEITQLDPATVGGLLATLATAPNGKTRTVGRPILVVNPADYYSIVFPATTIRTVEGGYANNVLPIPVDIVQSTAVPSKHAIFGIARRYLMGIGLSRNGRIETADQYRWLEDERVYKIKGFGNGRPKDNNAFLYLDITNLVPTYATVQNIPLGE